MSLPDAHLRELLRLLGDTQVDEIDCGEFLDLAAGYVERLRAGDVGSESQRRVVQHLLVCAECREECQALLRALAEPYGGDD